MAVAVAAMVGMSLTSQGVTAQAPAVPQPAIPEKLIAAYKVGETTLDQFLADGWTPGDIFRSKAGILAYRFSAENHTFEFMLGLCEGLGSDPQMADGLDSSLQIMKMTGKSIVSNWKNDMDIIVPTGAGVRCIKSHYLKFVDSRLQELRDLRPTP
jgi:hypothetical protein